MFSFHKCDFVLWVIFVHVLSVKFYFYTVCVCACVCVRVCVCGSNVLPSHLLCVARGVLSSRVTSSGIRPRVLSVPCPHLLGCSVSCRTRLL